MGSRRRLALLTSLRRTVVRRSAAPATLDVAARHASCVSLIWPTGVEITAPHDMIGS